MDTLSQDPIYNAINEGIRCDIEIVVSQGAYRAALILIFSGIDTMAHINRPPDKQFNDSNDFKNWVDRYFHVHGQTRVTPDEWWAARNAVIHTYGVSSKLHERSDVRMIGYLVNSKPSVQYFEDRAPMHIFVDILAMKESFFRGIENFLMEGFSDPDKKELLEERINKLLLTFPGKK